MVADAVWCVRAKTSSAHLKRNHQSNDLNGNSSRRVTMANVQIKKRAEKLWARTTCEKIKGANTFDEIAKAPKERWLNSSLVNSANKQIFNRGLFGTERKWNCHMNVFESMFHRRCQNKSVKTLFFQSSSPYCTTFGHFPVLYTFLASKLPLRFLNSVDSVLWNCLAKWKTMRYKKASHTCVSSTTQPLLTRSAFTSHRLEPMSSRFIFLAHSYFQQTAARVLFAESYIEITYEWNGEARNSAATAV